MFQFANLINLFLKNKIKALTPIFVLLLLIVPANKMTLAEKNEPLDVVIVGGGISGLTSGFVLKGYRIKILEGRPEVGGRTYSGVYRGFTYARGTEYLGKPEGILEDIIKTLNLKIRQIPYPADVQYNDGKFYYGEMGKASLLIKKSNLEEYNRFMRTIQDTYREYKDIPDLDMNSSIARLDNITAMQWFKENKFPKVFADTYNVTFKGLFGATIDEISALSALTEIAFDFEGSEEVADIDDLKNDGTPGKFKTGMYSFEKGISEIPLEIGQLLRDRIQTGTTVTKIIKNSKVFKVFFMDKNGKENFYEARSVILATPSPVSVEIAREVLSKEQKEIMNQVTYAPYLTVALFSEKPVFNKGFDMAFPDGAFFTDIYDATWIERHYNEKLKNNNAWVTTVYVAPGTYKDRSIVEMSDEAIMSKIYEQLNVYLPGSRDKILGFEVNRFYHAYPVMTPGAYKRLTHLHEITGDGLYLAGDFMIYPTFEAAAVSGELAAKSAMEWLKQE